MCGFAGFLSFAAPEMDAAERLGVLRAMGRAIAHRGPDDEQFYDDGTLSLVYRRLSIVDLAGGRQPIFDAQGNRFVVVNGEIYNHLALRNDLERRHAFSTRSDSEVPLHLLGERGPAGLQQLNGMFALACWDRSERRLLLARDRLGIKPMYIAHLPGGLLFGSELKALLAHPRCPSELDWSVLDIQLSQFRSPVASYVRGVEHLPGGHYLVAGPEGIAAKSYWSIDDHLGTARFGRDAGAYVREYGELLDRATSEHLLSDVPVGLHLSGGLDSSLMAAIVARTTRDLACFTVVERTSFRAHDVESAQMVTRGLGLPWYPVLFDFRTLLDEMSFDLERLEQSVYMMDSPRFDPEWFFKEELHRAARRLCPDMKVVLLGQGADEFAGGYSQRIDRPRADWSEFLDDEVVPWVRYHQALDASTPERYCGLRRAGLEGTTPGGHASFHRMMRLHTLQLQHHNLWHEDRTSMFQSLEARVPYLDHRLVELLASVPGALHAELFWNKHIIREAARARLPGFDHNHPKVPFFYTDDARSVDIMVHDMVRRTASAFLAKYPDLDGFPFDPRAIRGLVGTVLARRGSFYAEAWRLMECMVVAIFVQQCREPNRETFATRRLRVEGPALITERQWPAIVRSFSEEPVLPSAEWRPMDRVVIPPGAEILQPADPDQSNRYFLNTAGGISAQISIPPELDWMPRFLRNLGRGSTAEFTVADWEDEFEVPSLEFRRMLDTLYQAGFVNRVAQEG